MWGGVFLAISNLMQKEVCLERGSDRPVCGCSDGPIQPGLCLKSLGQRTFTTQAALENVDKPRNVIGM